MKHISIIILTIIIVLFAWNVGFIMGGGIHGNIKDSETYQCIMYDSGDVTISTTQQYLSTDKNGNLIIYK